MFKYFYINVEDKDTQLNFFLFYFLFFLKSCLPPIHFLFNPTQTFFPNKLNIFFKEKKDQSQFFFSVFFFFFKYIYFQYIQFNSSSQLNSSLLFSIFFFKKQLSPKHHFKHCASIFCFLGIHNFEKNLKEYKTKQNQKIAHTNIPIFPAINIKNIFPLPLYCLEYINIHI
jgi:hypothetical protein